MVEGKGGERQREKVDRKEEYVREKGEKKEREVRGKEWDRGEE